MMGTYKSLRVLFHKTNLDASNVVNVELENRLNSPATVKYPYHVGNNPLFAVITRDIYELSETIWKTEQEIQKAWNVLPGVAQDHYFYTLLVEEIQSTNEIENVKSTRREVTEALNVAIDENMPGRPKRFQEMASTFKLLIGDSGVETITFPQTLTDLRALYDQLLGAEVSSEDKLDGSLFRLGEVHVTDGSKSIHKGVLGEEEIKSRLSVALDVSSAEKKPMLVNALVGHFMVEHTHPFYDGNGRFGRFLLALNLRSILSAPTALSLSAEVMRQKRKYYKAFLQVEDPMNMGEVTFFISDMMDILLAAQMRLVESLRIRLVSLENLSQRIDVIDKEFKSLTPYHLQTLFMLGQILLFGPRSGGSLDEISKFLQRSKSTVRPMLKELTEAGLIEEVSRRPLVFALTPKGEEFLELEKPSLD
ncbi:hypothetical protein HMPREF9238_00427 [Gleimia europaea ACS-120-V-Col10b]|uniref:Fido domain-containing protein n=1 Tax=Gleimia europaea ACS-120-V-Col10b TaxID=883069 RepID=A0A9W5VW96_9ACTO|nr:hypothetical protein HMPREF9238_00427 [Gleimia europaea ACS-120-V-Col10b]